MNKRTFCVNDKEYIILRKIGSPHKYLQKEPLVLACEERTGKMVVLCDPYHIRAEYRLDDEKIGETLFTSIKGVRLWFRRQLAMRRKIELLIPRNINERYVFAPKSDAERIEILDQMTRQADRWFQANTPETNWVPIQLIVGRPDGVVTALTVSERKGLGATLKFAANIGKTAGLQLSSHWGMSPLPIRVDVPDHGEAEILKVIANYRRKVETFENFHNEAVKWVKTKRRYK